MTIRPLYPASRPSLDLNFAKTKRLDPRISFSRASAGTYFGSDGLLKSGAINEARFDHSPSTGESLGLLVEESRTNLFTNSEQLQTWASLMYDILIPNQIQGPSGLINAVKHVPSTISWGHIIYQNVAFSAVSYTLSVYAKPAGYNFLHVSGSAWGSWASYINFDLSNGTLAAGTGYSSYSITALANGWYRCSVTFTPAAGTNWVGFGAANLGTNLPGGFAGNGTSGIYLWGAQLEAGSFPTSYIPTPATFTSRASSATYYDANGVIQTASTNVARSAAFFPDSNGVMRPAGLLLEAAGTNLLTYSEQFDNAAWLKYALSVTANSIAAPDGTTTADTFGATAHPSYLYMEPTLTAAKHTFSVYAKAGTASSFQLQLVTPGNAAGAYCEFNLSAGTKGTVGQNPGSTDFTASIEKLSNGWYRCAISGTTTSATWAALVVVLNSSGKNIYLWGAQLEASSYPTSYIPTTTATVTRSADVSSSATVTRSADVAQITGTNFSSWYNQSEGTFCANLGNGKKSGRILEANDNTDNNRHGLVWTATNSQFFATTAGSTFFNSSVTTSTDPRKSAYAYKSGSYAGASAGLAPATNSGTSIPTITQIWIGGPVGNGSALNNYPNGTISRLTYWPTRLSDATLQAITQ